MPESVEIPHVFISYSHSSPAHKSWVRGLAEDLMGNGVEVTGDFWDLNIGHDMHAYMERMVSDPTINKVIMICDKQYAEKGDSRKNGVGIEAEIISGEIYNKTDQEKFIPVFSEVDEKGTPYLPVYCKSRRGIDMSKGQYKEGLNQLLRTIHNEPEYKKPKVGKKPNYNEPQHKKPKLGKKPDFANIDVAIRSSKFLVDEVCDSFRAGKNNANGLLEEYLEEFAKSMEKISMQGRANNCELIFKSIDDFLPHRDEIIKVFSYVASYCRDEESVRAIHRFFERVLPWYDVHWNSGSATSIDADNFKFLVHEMFLYAIAAFIKREKFECVSYLIDTPYHVANKSGSNPMTPFTSIRVSIDSFSIRHSNEKSNRISLRADLLMERADASGLDRREILQADFVLTIKDAVIADIATYQDGKQFPLRFLWYPDTYIYVEGNDSFKIFARAQSQKDFDKIKVMLGVNSPDDLARIVEKISGRKQGDYEYGYYLANIPNLCKSP